MLQSENAKSFGAFLRNPFLQVLNFSFALLILSSCASQHHMSKKNQAINSAQSSSLPSSTASKVSNTPPLSSKPDVVVSAKLSPDTVDKNVIKPDTRPPLVAPLTQENESLPKSASSAKSSDQNSSAEQNKAKAAVKTQYVSDILDVQGIQYSGNMKGYVTLSGEVYRAKALTIAHTSLPLGQKVELIDTLAGESVEVVVNDRPDSSSEHDFLMTPAVAKRLGIKKDEVRPLTVVVEKADKRVAKAKTTGETLVGYASYYADYFHGRQTANGERFNMHALTAAHRDLPLGTWVRVTNLKNGKQVDVRINDRGPYKDTKRRIIDLSLAAAKVLKMKHSGLARVKVEILKKKS